MRRIIQKPRTLAARSLPHFVLAALVAGALLVPARDAQARPTPEQNCQKGRYSAAAQYGACQQNALAKFFGGGTLDKYQAASGKCRTKYAAVWPKLQKKAQGSTCALARFTTDATTVTDNLTGLQWEKKTDDGTVHDKDNVYSWSAAPPYTAADGPPFTTFLRTLNDGGCFVGQCDWRQPTIAELQSILVEPYPCTTIPCIDPIFGSTKTSGYWSDTTSAAGTNVAWLVYFDFGGVYLQGKHNAYYVRAVRAGL